MKPLPQIPVSDLNFWQWVSRNLANFEIVSAIPTVDDLKKGDTVLYESGNVRRLYFNINGTIKFITIEYSDRIQDLDGDTLVEVERTADGDDVYIRTTGIDRIKIDDSGNVYIGDAGTTNYFKIDVTGNISFHGTARINWAKITANNITQGNGGHGAFAVADIQTKGDGNIYHIDETATDPGFELTTDFINVTAFNWVEIFATYDGAATHPVQISLYNFSNTTWDCFGAFAVSQAEITTAGEYTLENKSFFVPDDSDYIGTGGDAGDVRVRIRHTASGNASHDIDIDVIALYQ